MRSGSMFFKQVLAGMGVLLALTVVFGVAYPAAVWGISRLGIDSAEGSPLRASGGCVVGSALIGVDPAAPAEGTDPFFHARVTGSVADDDPFAPGDPAAASPTHQGPSSETLAAFVDARRTLIAERENVAPSQVPADAVTGSGSGVDRHISPDYARIQVPRVAAATGRSIEDVQALVENNTDGRQFGVLGRAGVNVTTLNVALDLVAPGCG
ncbi:MAG: potassium-transporting ATPase subunit C [Rhodococcus sp. (in: high G+C Gram-positive bacteria)]